MDQYFFGRTPILDRNKDIYGYECFFRSGVASGEFAAGFHTPDGSTRTALTTLEPSALAGDKRVFFKATTDFIESDLVDRLATERSVFELSGTTEMGPGFSERCHTLRERGYRFCLSQPQYGDSFSSFIQMVSFVKVDVAAERAHLAAIIDLLRKLPVKLVATRVETREDFELCKNDGFTLFEGHFFAKPSVITAKSISPSQALLLELSKDLARNAEMPIIESIFKKNPDLTFGLLKLMNSAFFSVQQKINSIRQAITLLGYDNLQKWVALLLFTIDHWDQTSNPLLEKVLIRGRMMELLAEKTTGLEVDADTAFITGILSLISVLFELPLPQIIAKLNLATEMQEALLDRRGALGRLLLLLEHLDDEDYQKVEGHLDALKLSPSDLFGAETRAILECQASMNQDAASEG